MRILHFVKIDFISAKKTGLIVLLFPALSLFLLLRSSDAAASVLFVGIYCLFAGIVVGTVPQSMQNNVEGGFLKMLPSADGEQIRGHFLFSFFCLTGFLLLALLTIRIAGLFNPAIRANQIPPSIWILLLGAALVFTGFENLLYTVIPGPPSRTTGIIRLAPAFVFFFGISFLQDHLQGVADLFVRWIRPSRCAYLFLICIVIYLMLMELCAGLERRKSR